MSNKKGLKKMAYSDKSEKLNITNDLSYRTIDGIQGEKYVKNPYVKNNKGEPIGKIVRIDRTKDGLIAYYKKWD